MTINNYLLNSEQVLKELNSLDKWQISNEKLNKSFVFNNYLESINFINQIAQKAEEMNHHPEILIIWGKVIINLITHDPNGLTKLDFLLAKQIDLLYSF